MKDVDSAARSRFLAVGFRTFAATSLVGFFAGFYVYRNPIAALIIGVVTGLICGVVAHLIIEHTGSIGVNFFYGRHRPIYSTFEQYEGDLNQARHLKTIKEYLKALALVNKILIKAPKLPEALYLKAEILWEGYHKGEDAKVNLEYILVLLPDKSETYHTWAQSLIDRINSE